MLSQTTVGASIVASGTAAYRVLAVGDGILNQTSSVYPAYVTVGSDGNIWATDFSGGCCPYHADLIQVTPSGTVTFFQPFAASADAMQLTSGPDGNLYVVVSSSQIARVSTSPQFKWQVPVRGAINDIATGPDGNVWFVTATSGGGTVGFVTPGPKVKQFTLPAGSGVPVGITAGPDNAIWFTLDGGQVARITTAGAITFFPMPAGIKASDITLGPDGNFWMTAGHHSGDGVSPNYVLRMTPSGAFTTFTTPTPDVGAGSITTGADGNLWFNETFNHFPSCDDGSGVGRVTPTGVITEFGAGGMDL